VGDDSHLVFRQKLLSENGSVRLGVDMVKQPGLFSPKFGATSSHVLTKSPQKSQENPESTFWPVSTGASRYHNCCIDGENSSEYFGCHLVLPRLDFCIPSALRFP
jgi:hypothetical protein